MYKIKIQYKNGNIKKLIIIDSTIPNNLIDKTYYKGYLNSPYNILLPTIYIKETPY